MALNLLKDFNINLPEGFIISPGSIAVSSDRIYLPAKNEEECVSRMFVFDYISDLINDSERRIEEEEFKLPFIEGIVYGGAAYYNEEIWIVSDEQIENKLTGCLERYTLSGEQGDGIGLPWMWGFKKFEALGLTVELNSFYILTKRAGWFSGEKLGKELIVDGQEKIVGEYRIEKYDALGEYEKSFKLDDSNSKPIGLTDSQKCKIYELDSEGNKILIKETPIIFAGNIPSNKLYPYDIEIKIIDDIKDWLIFRDKDDMNVDVNNIHGIGFNEGRFSVLQNNSDNNSYKIFIFDQDPNIVCDIEEDIKINPYSASITTRSNEVYIDNNNSDEDNTGFTGWFQIFKEGSEDPKQTCKPEDTNPDLSKRSLPSEIKMYFASAADFLSPTVLQHGLFRSVDHIKFIPEYTIPGLETGDIIRPTRGNKKRNNQRDGIPDTWQFEITDFKEGGNVFQIIFTKRIT